MGGTPYKFHNVPSSDIKQIVNEIFSNSYVFLQGQWKYIIFRGHNKLGACKTEMVNSDQQVAGRTF